MVTILNSYSEVFWIPCDAVGETDEETVEETDGDEVDASTKFGV